MGHASVSKSLCCPNVHPRHLHVVPPVLTESVVDDRVLAGISECPWAKKPKDGRWRTSTQRDGVSIKTQRRRQRETTSLFIPRHMKNDAKRKFR
jgi:hypothetical protein